MPRLTQSDTFRLASMLNATAFWHQRVTWPAKPSPRRTDLGRRDDKEDRPCKPKPFDHSRQDRPRRDFAIAGGLSPQGASRLMAVSTLHRKAPGETLFSEGDEADSVYEVVRGMLRLYKLLPDGRRQITGFLSAGQFPRPRARRCLRLHGGGDHRGHALPLQAQRPSTASSTRCRASRSALLAVASHELSAAQNQMLLLGRKAATEKVASFLLLMADQQGKDGEARRHADDAEATSPTISASRSRPCPGH